MRQHIAIAAFVAGLAGLAPSVAAQEAADSDITGMAIPQADLRFAEDAARGGLAEVELGRLAAEKAAAQEVKDFGQTMVDDHSAANEQLMQIAEEKQIDIPTELSPEAQAAKERLSGLSGAEFDRSFMEQMVIDHERTVGLFEQEATTGQDTEFKEFAQGALPKLREHLEQAQALSAQMSQTASPAGGAEPTIDHNAPEQTTAPAAGEEMIEDPGDNDGEAQN